MFIKPLICLSALLLFRDIKSRDRRHLLLHEFPESNCGLERIIEPHQDIAQSTDMAFAAHAHGLIAFLPQAAGDVATAVATVEKIVSEEGLRPLGWRDVPVNPDCLGASARAVMPTVRQFFLDDPAGAYQHQHSSESQNEEI